MQARMVLYQYDFCDAGACDGYKLSVKGVARLADMARMLPATNFHPIMVEASFQNPQLDARRRVFVLQTLGQLNVPVPDQLVVVGTPQDRGICGEDALILTQNMYNDTRARGAQLSSPNATYGASSVGGGSSGGGSSGNGQSQ
jgi:hypothetical protein